MRTDFFKSTVMWVAATAFMVGCSQDEIISSEPEMTHPVSDMKVIVNTNQFTGIDTETRATESTDGSNHHTTTFTEGDRIGIYLVDSEGYLTGDDQNIVLTYTNQAWEGTLSYVAGAQYVAYFPYNDTPVTNSEAKVEELITNTVTTEQGEPAQYYANDLMVASAVSPQEAADGNGYTVTFNFRHRNAMIEFVVPTSQYYYTASNGKQVVYSGENIALKENKISISGADYTPYKVAEITAESVYRCIVKPGEITFDFVLDNNGTEITFSKNDAPLSLAAGSYKRYKLTWEGAPESSGLTERAPQVGDFFFADGTIYPKELADKLESGEVIPNADQCVGIVFSTSTSTEDQSNGWKNGYVVALHNAANNNKTEVKWAEKNTDLIAELQLNDEVLTNLNGLTFSQLTNIDAAFYTAISTASAYAAALPEEGTSGWYLPSSGQLAAFANAFKQEGESPVVEGFKDNKCPKTSQYLKAWFEKAQGEYYDDTVRPTGSNNCWWSINYTDDNGTNKPYALNFETPEKADGNPKIGLLKRGYNQNGGCVRPVLAF